MDTIGIRLFLPGEGWKEPECTCFGFVNKGSCQQVRSSPLDLEGMAGIGSGFVSLACCASNPRNIDHRTAFAFIVFLLERKPCRNESSVAHSDQGIEEKRNK